MTVAMSRGFCTKGSALEKELAMKIRECSVVAKPNAPSVRAINWREELTRFFRPTSPKYIPAEF